MERHYFDKSLIALTLILVLVGLATLYSAGQTDVPSAVSKVWQKQLIWIGLGIVVAVASFRLSPRLLEWLVPAI